MERALEVERVVPELERALQGLGRDTLALDRDWCLARFAEFYDGGIEAFGLVGPDDDELLDAELWFLLDCELEDGLTPLERRRGPARAFELLARSELRAWRIEALRGPGMLSVLSPLDGSRARLELAGEPWGAARPGALLVGRSVPLGPERWTLVGGGCVVDPEVQADFELLLASLEAPAGEFWRVHGGVLARAAWSWPEVRGCTLEGELVENALVAYELPAPAEIVAALDADPELDGDVEDPIDAQRWRWRWEPPAARDPLPEPGVRYERCREDLDVRPYLVDVDLGADGELWLVAATPGRLTIAEGLLRQRFGGLLGPVAHRAIEGPDVTQRWRQRRLDRAVAEVERSIRRIRRRAA